MKKPLLLAVPAALLGCLCLSLAAPAATRGVQKEPPKAASADTGSGSYSVDSVHSTVIFKIKHLNTSWAFGRFEKISGQFELDDKSPEKSSVSITIDVDSINTGSEKRDNHLKSPDFFDAAQFPSAVFTSKSVKKSGDGKFSVTGDLELHGVTKSVTIDLERTGFSDSKMGVRIGFFGQLALKRSDYGVSAMPDGIGDEAQLTISVEAVRTDAKR
jgi:polyisoprenoid-binding protein YceI